MTMEINTIWCVSSAWLECLPVTQEVTGSSPVRTAPITAFCAICRMPFSFYIVTDNIFSYNIIKTDYEETYLA